MHGSSKAPIFTNAVLCSPTLLVSAVQSTEWHQQKTNQKIYGLHCIFQPKFLQKNAHELMIIELHSCDLTPLRCCETPSGASFRATDGQDSCFVGVKDQGTAKQLLYRAVLEKVENTPTFGVTFVSKDVNISLNLMNVSKKSENKTKRTSPLIEHSQLGLCEILKSS